MAAFPSGEENALRGDRLPCAPMPEHTDELSDEGGASLSRSSEPQEVMDTECPAQVGTKLVTGQDATGSLLCVLR